MNISAGQLDLTSLATGVKYTVTCAKDRIRIEGESPAGTVEVGFKAQGGPVRAENGWLDLFTLTPGATYSLAGGAMWQIHVMPEADRRTRRHVPLLRHLGRLWRWK